MRFIAPLVLLVLCSSCSTMQNSTANDVIAKIGTTEVTSGQLQDRILGRYYGSRALLGLVQEELFLQEAARRTLTISEQELSQKVEAEVTRLFGAEGPQRDRNLADFAQRGLDLEDVRRELRAELRNSMIINRVVQVCRTVDDQQLTQLYRKTYESPRVRIRHIAFPFDGECLDDPTHIDMVRQQAQRVAAELAGGADFSALARAHSGNRRTAASGGEIGWINRDVMKDATLANSVFGMAVGTYSEPLREGDYGYHIFQVEDRIDPCSMEEVRDELVAHIRQTPATADEILAVERQLREHTDVQIFSSALRRGTVARVRAPAPLPNHRFAPPRPQADQDATAFSATDRSPLELLEQYSPDMITAPPLSNQGTAGSTVPSGWDTDDQRD
ncbi:MAG: peptidylprolyl isomerase [Planctomycetota bacterium]